MNNKISAHFQIDAPVDSFVPAEPGQLIDLDEFYEDTGQEKITAMVQGTEALSLGMFTKDIAERVGIKDTSNYDPFPSAHNSVLGAEGFFTTLTEGFKGFIEGIIKYIKMAFSWVANTVKGILGFRKSERIEKAIDDSLGNLREEFKTTLNGLGFPGKDYDLEEFIGKMPSAVDRTGQLTVMRSKFESDKSAITGLKDVLPILQQCILGLSESGEKAVKALEAFKRVIKEEYTRTRVRAQTTGMISASESPEINRIVKASQEVMKALEINELTNKVAALLNTLYKVNFTNEALTNGFNKVRKELETIVVTSSVKLTPVDMKQTLMDIQALNKRYVEISDNSIDMTGIDIRALGAAIDKTDADKVKTLSDYYQTSVPVESYQIVAVSLRNYTDFCQMVSRQLLVVERQIHHLTSWYARAHLWYMHGLLNDMEKLRQLNLEARAEGFNPTANADGYSTIKLDFIPEADSKTFMEKFAGTSQIVLENDIGGLKTRYNTLVKQLGIGKTI